VIGAAVEPVANRRLEQLYEISKLFAAFDVAENTLDAALKVITAKLPLESAILIEAAIGGHTDVVVWPSEGSDPARLQAAKTYATGAYAYLVGARSFGARDLHDDLHEELGATTLPAPDRTAYTHGDPTRFIVLPLVVGRGTIFGALQFEGAARLDRSDLAFISAITNQLAIALDRNRAWNYDVLSRQKAQLLQAKYQTLVDHLDHAFVWEADAETRRISYVSAQVAHMLGFPPQHCLDEPNWWSARVHPDDRAQWQLTFERALAEPGNKRFEHRCIAADGSIRWLRTSIHLVGTRGESPHFQGVSLDITAARAAQEHVREQLSFTSAMASSLAEGTLAVDLDDRITFINDAGAAMLGYRDREVLGRRSADILQVQTSEGATVESPLAVAVRTGRVRNDAHVFVPINRRRFAASYTATQIRRDNRVTGAMLAFDDISERKQEQAADHFLLDAGVMLSASLDSATVAIAAARLGVPLLGDVCFIDVVSSDDQLVHVACVHADSTVQHDLDLVIGAEPRAPVFATPVAEVVATGRSMQVPVVTEAWLSGADARVTRGLGIRSALIVPLTLGDRQLGALTFCMTEDHQHRTSDVALAEELARRSALAIEHARLYEQARHAVALREQTLAIVSHDLRAPLAAIMLASAVLGDDELARASPRAKLIALKRIESAAGHMDRMLGDLLDFASIAAGRLSINARPNDVTGILDESIASFEATAKKRLVTLVQESRRDLPPIQCDRDRILQVIANLLGNALKSMTSGGSVWLRAKANEREVVVSISDTGPGISIADQKRLFERYWRSPNARYKGTGLGLAIARGLIEAHHGRLWVESEHGHGATFSFTVPLAEPRPLGKAPVEPDVGPKR